MEKKIVFISVFLFYVLGLNAQTLETGLFAGASYYLGDINPGKHFDQSLFAAGAVARYNKDDRLAFRLSLLLGQVQASDSLMTAYYGYNDVTFKSKITEISGLVEFNFLPYETGSAKHRYTPYIFAGIGIFFSQPNDKLVGLSIPFGIGYKYSLTEKIGIGIEWGMRKTFTDYIDDVYKTEDGGNPQTKDWFNFYGLTLTYKFNIGKIDCANF